MQIKFYKPQNTLLQKYIESFYILMREPDDKTITYLAFPGTYYFVSINENSVGISKDNRKKFTHSSGQKTVSSFIYNFEGPDFITYEGATSELNICFKPLGINAFLEKELAFYGQNRPAVFTPFPDYQDYLLHIHSIKNIDDKIRAAESYWLSKLTGFEHPFLHSVIEEMQSEDTEKKTISDIALSNNISRITLYKEFERHLCTVPAQFKKVARFRKAMKKYSAEPSAVNLTNISYLVDYFDQSHMIKDFKVLTNHSPKNFFSKLSILENGRINWMFL